MSYSGVHQQVRSRRGRAPEWSCAMCAVPAEHWAYTHDALYEMVSDSGHPYSFELADYIPLCRPCHKVFDNPGGYQAYKTLHLAPFPRDYGAYQRDYTPHLFQ